MALGGYEYAGSLIEYPNVPATIGMVLSRNPVLIGPLSESLGVEDLHDLIEVMLVDMHNARVVARIDAANRRRQED